MKYTLTPEEKNKITLNQCLSDQITEEIVSLQRKRQFFKNQIKRTHHLSKNNAIKSRYNGF